MYLTRSFEELEHAQYFLSGGIRIKSFADYRKEEEEAMKSGRADPNEGSYLWQGFQRSEAHSCTEGRRARPDRVYSSKDDRQHSQYMAYS